MIRKLLLVAGAVQAWAALAGPPTSSFQLGGSQSAPEPTLGERLALAFSDPQLLLYLGLTLLAAALFLLARRKVRRWLRWGMLISSLAVLGFYFGGCPCPVGSVTKLGFIFTDPVVYLIPFVLFLIPVVAALLVGRVFCGWVCPLGAVQEALGGWSRRRNTVPTTLDRPLRYLKYLLLAGLVALAALGVRLHWSRYDPFRAIFTGSGTWIAIGLAAAFGSLSLVVYRPWCRYVCPLGAVLALATRAGLARRGVDAESCVGCGLCARNCALGAIAVKGGKARLTGECIRCGDCALTCPGDALD
ncbi:4Fe-4S binding protein [Candidatus Bipolaricaulota sp. J31]